LRSLRILLKLQIVLGTRMVEMTIPGLALEGGADIVDGFLPLPQPFVSATALVIGLEMIRPEGNGPAEIVERLGEFLKACVKDPALEVRLDIARVPGDELAVLLHLPAEFVCRASQLKASGLLFGPQFFGVPHLHGAIRAPRSDSITVRTERHTE